MVPLPTISTPRSRSGARRAPSSKCESKPPLRVNRELHDRHVRLRESVHQHRPGAVIDSPVAIARSDAALDDASRERVYFS
jgi:hypothetical protein